MTEWEEEIACLRQQLEEQERSMEARMRACQVVVVVVVEVVVVVYCLRLLSTLPARRSGGAGLKLLRGRRGRQGVDLRSSGGDLVFVLFITSRSS